MSEPPGPTAKPASQSAGLDQPPPFWSRWERIYLVVAALLAAQVAAFWLLSRWAS